MLTPRNVVLTVLALALLWALSGWLVSWKLTRRHGPRQEEPPPTRDWARFEGLRLRTHDGLSIGAWFGAVPGSRASALIVHGYRGSRSAKLVDAEIYAREGLDVLLISMRAHGDSDGDRHDVGWSSRHEVVAAVAWLEARFPGRPIVVDATSMGSAAAIFAAAELGARVRGYLLQEPYVTLDAASGNRVRALLPPILGDLAAASLWCVGRLTIADAARIRPIDRIGDIPAELPVVVLHGELDRYSTPEEMRALVARAGPHAELIGFPGAAHCDLPQFDVQRYRGCVASFLTRCGLR